MEQIERQELHCHNCMKYVQFNIDLSLNGNHVLECPNCGHEHCRIVKDGVITDSRWSSRNRDNNNTVYLRVNTVTITFTSGSTYDSFRGWNTGTINTITGGNNVTNGVISAMNNVNGTGTHTNYFVGDTGTTSTDGRDDTAASYIYGSWMNLAYSC